MATSGTQRCQATKNLIAGLGLLRVVRMSRPERSRWGCSRTRREQVEQGGFEASAYLETIREVVGVCLRSESMA